MNAISVISCITYSVPNLMESRRAFTEYLDYMPLIEAAIPKTLAYRWQAPLAAGNKYCLLQDARGEPVYIRLLESPQPTNYAPLQHFGWNAAELHVQDVHGLAEQLKDSPFQIIGGPRDLLDNDAVIAMQVLGPGKELLYLTQINHPGMQETYGRARSKVGSIFIAVMGSSNLPVSVAFYRAMSTRTTQRKAFNIRVLANAHGLEPLQARFDISSAVFSGSGRIEMDAYPASAFPKPQIAGQLPPGLSMLTVTAPAAMAGQLAEHCDFAAGPACPPYSGRLTGLITGPDGEFLEIILQD
jgi:hypothetical protein